MTRTMWTGAAAALLLVGTALAATPAQNCASRKNKEAGKYARCRHKAEAKFALNGDAAERTMLLARCTDRYALLWPVIESSAGGTCPSTGDESAIRQYLDTATTDVATALAGGPLAGQAQPLETGQTQCWDVAGQLVPCAWYPEHDGGSRHGLDRAYVDNADGTVTDTRTGLMWEKLSDDTGLHDKDNIYRWDEAFPFKIALLNQVAFAGHTDWRMPNLHELQSLVDYGTFGPAISPAFNTSCAQWCTVLTCSCTRGDMYWSSTTLDRDHTLVWAVSFQDGSVAGSYGLRCVRAVRGGS